MSYWHFLIITLCFLSAGLTIYRYSRFSLKNWQKIALISLRILLMISVLLSFLEPVFRFERLLSPDSTISVLMDASQSMNLFSPDTNIIPLLEKLNSSDSSFPKQKNRFKFYLFGDSLREISKPSDISFSDKKSFFPFSLNNPEIKSSSEILLITDGNWSNNSIPHDALSGKNVYYHNLSSFTPNPYLKINFSAKNNSVTANCGFKIESKLEVRTQQKSKCTINLYNKNALIYNNEFVIDSGTSYQTVSIPVSGLESGKHILRIEALLDTDSLHSVDYAMYSTIPQSFKYALVSAGPSLNQRFIKLAVSRDKDFDEVSLKNSTADIIFFLSWNSKIKKEVQKLNKNGILVFASILPNTSSFKPSKNISYIKHVAGSRYFNNFNTSLLPPPSRIFLPENIAAVSPLLSITHDSDTSSIIFSGNFSGRALLALAVSDFWKWDFWPVSHENTGEESVLFSDLFITVLKDMLIEQSFSDQYTAYPISPVVENDSMRFYISLPSDIDPANTDSVDISFTITNKTFGSLIDTTFRKKISGLPNQTITLAGVSNGNYSYKTVLRSKNHKFEYSDTLFVKPDNRELMINGQNNSLLKEFGYRVTITDTLFEDNKDQINEVTVTEHFSITRSWYLLSVILLLIFCELILRQRFKLD